MALSDEELRTLEQIEDALQQEDPDFGAGIDIDRLRRRHLRVIIVAVLLFLVGAVLLVAGLVTTYALVVPGILIALCGGLAMAAAPALVLRQQRRFGR